MAGNPLANFGAGFLGGYRDVLGMKMKEDAQAKRDEALANRQMNLEKLRQEFEGAQRAEDRGLRKQEIDQRATQDERMYNLQKQQLSVQQANAAAARKSSADALAEQVRHHKALEEAADPVKQYDKAIQIKAKELNRITDPGEKALFENSGFTTYKEYQVNQSKLDADVRKERADVASKAIEGVQKALSESGKSAVEYGAEVGVTGKSNADVLAQLQYHAAASAVASYDKSLGRGPKEKLAESAVMPDATQLAGMKEALNTYDPKTATPEQTKAYDAIQNRLESMPKAMRLQVLKSIATPPNPNPYPQDSDEYIMEEARREKVNQKTLAQQRADEELLMRYQRKR